VTPAGEPPAAHKEEEETVNPDGTAHASRGPLIALLDWLTPPPLRIYYGPDAAAKWAGSGYRFSWRCERCIAQHPDPDGERAGFTRGQAAAQAKAKAHRRLPGHRWMRVVYDPEESRCARRRPGKAIRWRPPRRWARR
jgi:hypothetical protein